MYPKIEKLIKKYFSDECLMIKLTGESSEEYDVEFIIDMDDLYLKTSFIAYKKDVEKWKKEGR